MRLRFLLMVSGAFSLLLAAVAVACGGGGGALTLEEYFQRLDAAENELSAAGEQVAEPEFNDDDVFDEAEKQALRENLDAFFAILEDFRNALADLEPPDEVAEQHTNTIARLDDFAEALRDSGDRIQELESLDELEDAFADVDAADESVTQACFDLQAVADANNIAVDLECEEGEEEQ